jgi:hypothetical protein
VLGGLVGEIEVVAEVRRQACGSGEDRQGEAGDDLVRAQRDHEERMDQGHRAPGKRGDENGDRQRADVLHRPEAHHGADEHHPLDPEVQDTRPLRQQLTERGVEKRRAVDDRRGQDDDDDRVVDAAGREDHAGASVRRALGAIRMR